MGKYGKCENCGCTMEAAGGPNCDETQVNEWYDYLHEVNEKDK